MKKLMIVGAGAVALGCSAFAAPWFDGGVKEGWPSGGTGGTWSNTVDSAYVDGAVKVKATADKPLSFVAEEAKPLAADAKPVTVTSEIAFTPFAAAAIPSVPSQAKAGVIAVAAGAATNFYVLAKGAGDANVWTPTTLAATGDSAVVAVRLAGGKVTYKIDDVSTDAYDIVLPADATVSTAHYVGSGKVVSLSAVCGAAGAVVVDPTTGEEKKVEIADIAATAKAGEGVLVPAEADQKLVQDASGNWTLTVDGETAAFKPYYDVTQKQTAAGVTQYDVALTADENRNGAKIEDSETKPAVSVAATGAMTVQIPNANDELYYALESARTVDFEPSDTGAWHQGAKELTSPASDAGTQFSRVKVSDKGK